MNKQIDITKLSLTELKALAYDQNVDIANIQQGLKIINTEIERRLNAAATPAISQNTVPMTVPEPVTPETV